MGLAFSLTIALAISLIFCLACLWRSFQKIRRPNRTVRNPKTNYFNYFQAGTSSQSEAARIQAGTSSQSEAASIETQESTKKEIKKKRKRKDYGPASRQSARILDKQIQ